MGKTRKAKGERRSSKAASMKGLIGARASRVSGRAAPFCLCSSSSATTSATTSSVTRNKTNRRTEEEQQSRRNLRRRRRKERDLFVSSGSVRGAKERQARDRVVVCSAEDDENEVVEFGYNRKDVILICTVPLVGGYLTYYGLQKLFGLNPIEAGNYVQVIFVFILCVGWCATYLFRVGTKNMTYTQQLKDYEEAVMEKRLEEMSDSEIEGILNQGMPSEEVYKEESGL